MNQDQLLENLHKEHDAQPDKLRWCIDKIDKEMQTMVKVIVHCACEAPHLIERTRIVGGASPCRPHCPTCIAKRFLSNSLTEEDLKLLGVKI